MSAWYSREEKELVGLKTFDLLIESVGVFGVTGLTQFYGFSIVKEIQELISKIKIIRKDKKFRSALHEFLKVADIKSTLQDNAQKLYNDIVLQSAALDNIVLTVAELGQKQLLRRQLANILSFKCKLDSNALYCSLDSINKALLNDISLHYRSPTTTPYPGGDNNHLLFELAKYLENVGLSDPFGKIYLTNDPPSDLSAILFLLLLRQVGKFNFDAHVGTKPAKKKIPWMMPPLPLVLLL